MSASARNGRQIAARRLVIGVASALDERTVSDREDQTDGNTGQPANGFGLVGFTTSPFARIGDLGQVRAFSALSDAGRGRSTPVGTGYLTAWGRGLRQPFALLQQHQVLFGLLQTTFAFLPADPPVAIGILAGDQLLGQHVELAHEGRRG